MMTLLCTPIVSLFQLRPTKEILKAIFTKLSFSFSFFLHLSLGLKTYLISGRKSEHDVQCGCSQVGQSGGDFVGVSLSPCPHLRTPDLICGGAQAAPPLLPHQPPDRMGVSNED